MQAKELIAIYYALFNSIISYGITVWGGSYKYNSIRSLQILQNRILKIIPKNHLVEYYPLNIKQLFIYESLIYHYLDLQNKFKGQTNNID